MACYLDELPKDIRTLLEHYTLRENWEALRAVLTANSSNLDSAERNSVSECMWQLRLQTRFVVTPHYSVYPTRYDIKLDMHPEDLVTDVILNRVIQRMIDSTCLIDARYLRIMGEINGNLEGTRSRLRLITTMRNGKYYTNVISMR